MRALIANVGDKSPFQFGKVLSFAIDPLTSYKPDAGITYSAIYIYSDKQLVDLRFRNDFMRGLSYESLHKYGELIYFEYLDAFSEAEIYENYQALKFDYDAARHNFEIISGKLDILEVYSHEGRNGNLVSQRELMKNTFDVASNYRLSRIEEAIEEIRPGIRDDIRDVLLELGLDKVGRRARTSRSPGDAQFTRRSRGAEAAAEAIAEEAPAAEEDSYDEAEAESAGAPFRPKPRFK